MSLIEITKFKSDKLWIGKKLGITQQRLEEVMQVLQNLNLIKINEFGEISNTHRSMTTITDSPSEVLKQANEKSILQAIEKLHEVAPSLRDVTSMTLPIDPNQIPAAKELIRKFKAKMAKLMAKNATSEVYNLNIQLVPVTKIGV